MRVLITGGAGFIGSNFICHLLENHPDWLIVNLDKLTYAGNLENLREAERKPGYKFIRGDVADWKLVEQIFKTERISHVVHMAAESHVDRSIIDPSAFVNTNIKGTYVLLEVSRQHGISKFLQVSTDEVYGSLSPTDPPFIEESPVQPNNPYSASKASADLLAKAYYRTYGLPVIITRCSNNYGPFQHPEKLIPTIILNALADKPIPVYGDGLNIRDWIYVLNHCRALETVIQNGLPGEIYNIGANNERSNLEVARAILKIMGKPESLIAFVTDRPGHDARYAINSRKIQTGLNWQPEADFHEALISTVKWYSSHRDWWKN